MLSVGSGSSFSDRGLSVQNKWEIKNATGPKNTGSRKTHAAQPGDSTEDF